MGIRYDSNVASGEYADRGNCRGLMVLRVKKIIWLSTFLSMIYHNSCGFHVHRGLNIIASKDEWDHT